MVGTDAVRQPPSFVSVAVRQARDAARVLATAEGSDRNRGVGAIALFLEDNRDDILEANTLDLEMSREMAVPDLVQEWLKLTPERLQTTVTILRRLEKLSDPLQQVTNAPYQLDPSQTYAQQIPLGTVALVYEAFPELAAIAAGLCLKTGNALLFRGGPEATHSNAAIASVLQQALAAAKLPTRTLQLLPCEESSIQELLVQHEYVNLAIPYGRPALVQQTAQSASVPILRSAMGNCYLYLSYSGDCELAGYAIADSHESEPDPVNAIEKVLVHTDVKPTALQNIFHFLDTRGFELRGDARLCAEYPEHLQLATDSEWGVAYLNKIVAFGVANSIETAIEQIARDSSGHADCIVTESYRESRQFALGVDSALVYINSSPRFYRHSPQGESVFLGMSNQKGYRRGFIGLDSLTTFKQVVQGNARRA
ncbi:gamma-glutamyl phosphate reductase [Rubidibacter lacunae KORDI 51-2]|uniref:Gamma-glutamyl phosphate reductase n=1 Tax=Rubidibacter lacunae KORDI 51-2 TaxID=582515 RepID=U5DKV0_9CHRO|nr:glutamate-5-semialdehyde dehydrogenase [Rubidibacter lacunae]ERN40350.1 gamma-glutamyl phosphate reductase [Rubidibacter lacunae KORDI 51-2]